jgi:hypothetical protein
MFHREDHLWGLLMHLIDLTLLLLIFLHHLGAPLTSPGRFMRGFLLGLFGSSTGFDGEMRLRCKLEWLERGLVKEADLEGAPVNIKLVKAGGVLGGMCGGGMKCQG